MRGARRLSSLALVLLLAGCVTQPMRPPTPRKVPVYRPPPPQVTRSVPPPAIRPQPPPPPVARSSPSDLDGPPAPHEIPKDLHLIPDPVPVKEPKSAAGNPDTYEVYGKTYEVQDSSAGYREKGKASWYGKKFHGRKTSSGEKYNMFAMTAAHRTLPIPTYLRVTNLSNGKSCVVRVNDRGPFKKGRIIDLSYAAATKLGMLHHGEVPVEIQAITPGRQAPPESQYLEVGAFSDPLNAYSLREEVAALGTSPVEIRSETRNASPWHRVLVGPFADWRTLESTRQRLESEQFAATPVPN